MFLDFSWDIFTYTKYYSIGLCTIVFRDYIHCRRLLPTGFTRTQPLQHTSGYLLL